jgi:acyl-CoA synthetase (AMP-forming)/AMP-acid ligase II
VTHGYLSPPMANSEAFCHGWLRTGDEGSFDEDGYLALIGRLKDIINVGGEKVAPAEVDEVLMQHPFVVQALSFAVPCRTKGERVYAAVVLDGELSESSLRLFAGDRLARFKVPEKILLVDSIPKGPTGKLQRRGMAERLGLLGDA